MGAVRARIAILILASTFAGCRSYPSTTDVDEALTEFTKGSDRDLSRILDRLSRPQKRQDGEVLDYALRRIERTYPGNEARVLAALNEASLDTEFQNMVCGLYLSLLYRDLDAGTQTPRLHEQASRDCVGITHDPDGGF
jgi:hypothetical protein